MAPGPNGPIAQWNPLHRSGSAVPTAGNRLRPWPTGRAGINITSRIARYAAVRSCFVSKQKRVLRTSVAKMSDYRSIPCADYDRLELAILHHERLRLRWSEGRIARLEWGQPLDLVTENGAEFLVFRGLDGAVLRVRLDHLRVLI